MWRLGYEQWDEKRGWMATSTLKFEWFEVFKKHFGKFWDALGGMIYPCIKEERSCLCLLLMSWKDVSPTCRHKTLQDFWLWIWTQLLAWKNSFISWKSLRLITCKPSTTWIQCSFVFKVVENFATMGLP